MPSIASRTVPIPANYEPVSSAATITNKPILDVSNNNLSPGLNSTLRCSLPPIFAATDNLRQFYMGGSLPQYRVLPAPSLTK